MAKKPVILIFIHFYLPGYKSGGPVRSLSNLVAALSDHFEFKVITLDRDHRDKEPYPNIKTEEWTKQGQAQVLYLSPDQLSFSYLKKRLNQTEYDFLYLNSFFSKAFAIKPLILRRQNQIPNKPTVIAPRGEFSPGALQISKIKKKIYLSFAKLYGLHQGLIWQATSHIENQHIQNIFGKSTMTSFAENFPSQPQLKKPSKHFSSGGSCKIIFLSRVNPKKNLDFVLSSLKNLNQSIELNIYGVVDDNAYWKHCQTLIAELPKNISVHYKGPIPHQNVLHAMAQHDLFFFPTRGENFGHVIHESLSAGTPALLSNETPWQDLEEKNVGWVYTLDKKQPFQEAIVNYINAPLSEKKKMSEKCIDYASQYAKKSDRIQQYKKLFKV